MAVKLLNTWGVDVPAHTIDSNKDRSGAGIKHTGAAAEVLANAGGPMHYTEIWKAVEEIGARSTSKNPAKSLVSSMSSDDRFESVGDGKWDLAEWVQSEYEDECESVL